MDKKLHIIAFNTPYPPNYGGIIDIYYKIKALHQCGVKVILHAFSYERNEAKELESICESVYYYKRKTGLRTNLSFLPYNVYGRKSDELIQRLLADNYPILFEGLHTCYYLNDPRLKNRIKICRTANIEHDYYRLLAKAEANIIKRLFFNLEGFRFQQYEQTLRHADHIVSVSQTDQQHYQQLFPEKSVSFIPCFHANNKLGNQTGSSEFILYHGKLSVPENRQAALYLIKTLFSKLNCTCVIAGMDPSETLYKAAAKYPNIRIEANPSETRMNELIRDAHIHTLITFQPTGLKLKLLNSLFAGRHILTNSDMLYGSGLEELCTIANTPEEMLVACHKLLKQPFNESESARRSKLLIPDFDNLEQAKKLETIIYADRQL